MLRSSLCSLVILVLLTAPSRAENQPRQVFVLHSGLHTILSDPRPNRVTENIRELLLENGVAERDVILLDNPFPLASWKNMFPPEAVSCFLDSMLPGSTFSQQVYLGLHKALVEHGVRPGDRLIWVGHSAGGQVGITMANLARDLDRYEQLRRNARPYHFDMIVALGAPLGTNSLPDDVKVRLYFSPQDRVVRWACSYGSFVLHCLGYTAELHDLPVPLPSNAVVRVFQGIEHPCWDEERVVHRLLTEVRGDRLPAWQRSSLPISLGPGLAQLVVRGLEDNGRLTIEDPLGTTPAADR